MINNGHQLFLFPTFAYQDHELNSWIAKVHGWSFKADQESNFQRATAGLLRRALKVPKERQDPPYFRERSWGFVVENHKKVLVEVSHQDGSFIRPKSKANGHFRGIIDIQLDLTSDIIEQTKYGSLKTTLSAGPLEQGENVQGTVHLLQDHGLSIISDIDDTIKKTNVADKQEMLRNSFLRPYMSVDGMAELFQSFAFPETSFHYVSATPWQLYSPIANFLNDHHFPEGTIHLRKFALKDITFLKKIFPAYKKKRDVIQSIISQFPNRQFLLFGDSGEKDPEMYGKIARTFPSQVLQVCIRNTTNEAPDSVRFRRAFHQVPTEQWFVFSQAEQLHEYLSKHLKDKSWNKG